MRKILLMTAAALLTAQAGFAQYLYGPSVAAGIDRPLVRFDPATNTFATLLKSFNYYQPVSTKDTVEKAIYYMVPNMAGGTAPDSIVKVRLTDTVLTKWSVTKGALPFPMYTNGKLVSASAQGMAEYNLSTRQLTVIDNNVKITGLHSADFDHTRGRYICMKRSSNSAIADTLFVYNLAARSVNRYVMGVSSTSQEMVYSPATDKVLFLAAWPNSANFGIFSFHLGTQQLVMETPYSASGGTLVNCSTFDQTGDRYFFVKTTNNNGTGFNVQEYRLANNTLVDHLVGPPAIGFAQYFDHLRVTTPGGNNVGYLSTENPFKMYPNPAGNQLTVSIDLKGRDAALRIADLTGKIVWLQDKAAAENQVNISSLPNGQYVLSIAFEDKVYSRLFVKGH